MIIGAYVFRVKNEDYAENFHRLYWTNQVCRAILIISSTQTEGTMALNAHLAELTEKHKLLERRIEQEMSRPARDDVRLRRLKSEKLKLKDEMVRLSGTRH